MGLILDKRNNDAATAAMRVRSEANKYGALHSSRTTLNVRSAYEEMYEDICRDAWSQLHHIAVTIGVKPDDTLVEQLRDIFDDKMKPLADRYLSELQEGKSIIDNDASQETGADAPASCDPAGTGEVMDAPADGGQGGRGPSPSDIAEEEQAWDEAMHQAASLAKAQKKLPGAVDEAVRGAHASTVDWRTLLRRYMTDAAKRDYSWSQPNRRFIDSGLYLPSIRSEGIDTIAVIVDTSGSLPAGTLAEFWAEVREVASELQPERVIVLQVDAAVQDAAEYTASELPDEIEIRGRGGTDFRPGFAWL